MHRFCLLLMRVLGTSWDELEDDDDDSDHDRSFASYLVLIRNSRASTLHTMLSTKAAVAVNRRRHVLVSVRICNMQATSHLGSRYEHARREHGRL